MPWQYYSPSSYRLPLTGWLVWLSYQHPKAYAKITLWPWEIISTLSIGALFLFIVVASIHSYNITQELRENPDAIVGPAKDDVVALLNVLRYAGISILVLVGATTYFRAIIYIGKTINESKEEDGDDAG